MKAFDFPWREITLTDFEDDFKFSWPLSWQTKKQLAEIFMARMQLNISIGRLDRVLWNRTAADLLAIGEKPDYAHEPPSNHMPVDEIESDFQKWLSDHGPLLSKRQSGYIPQLDKRILRAEQLHTKLTFE